MKWAAETQNSRNAAAQRAAVYAVQEFWQRAGSPPECATTPVFKVHHKRRECLMLDMVLFCGFVD